SARFDPGSGESGLMRVVDLTTELNFNEVDALLATADVGESVETTVNEILQAVRERGDAALCEYTKRFEAFDLTPELMRGSREEMDKSASDAEDELADISRRAANNVREFHERQIEESWEYYAGEGIRLGVRCPPIASPGSYIPGAKAASPSSVLMKAIPAQVAGVKRMVVVTPPRSLEDNP